MVGRRHTNWTLLICRMQFVDGQLGEIFRIWGHKLCGSLKSMPWKILLDYVGIIENWLDSRATKCASASRTVKRWSKIELSHFKSKLITLLIVIPQPFHYCHWYQPFHATQSIHFIVFEWRHHQLPIKSCASHFRFEIHWEIRIPTQLWPYQNIIDTKHLPANDNRVSRMCDASTKTRKINVLTHAIVEWKTGHNNDAIARNECVNYFNFVFIKFIQSFFCKTY